MWLYSAGPIVEQGTHFCDLSRYFGGEVDISTVTAHSLEWDETAGHLSKQSIDESKITPDNRIPRVTAATWLVLFHIPQKLRLTMQCLSLGNMRTVLSAVSLMLLPCKALTIAVSLKFTRMGTLLSESWESFLEYGLPMIWKARKPLCPACALCPSARRWQWDSHAIPRRWPFLLRGSSSRMI